VYAAEYLIYLCLVLDSFFFLFQQFR